MKTIKFRAWTGKEMLSNVGYHPHQAEDLGAEQEHYLTNPEGRYIVGAFQSWDMMQYIGRKDKEGREIYEGDICELRCEFFGIENSYYSQDSFDKTYTGVVCFMPSIGYYLKTVKVLDNNEETYLNEFSPRKNIVMYRTKVIGNIHEHKNLLDE